MKNFTNKLQQILESNEFEDWEDEFESNKIECEPCGKEFNFEELGSNIDVDVSPWDPICKDCFAKLESGRKWPVPHAN